ncbi:putative matrilysin [Helianthus annuus]|nr:putative matrilysin [Helianthus annuus]
MASKLTFLCVLFFVFSLSKGNETIKRLQGSKKGSNVQGLHNLKLYLARFGYLNYQHTPNHVNSSENDEFDEELEAALKDYQNFHHLNPTGMLDEPTVSQMLMPRCGVPDKKISNNHESKLLHIVSHYTFFNNSPRWGKNRLTYAFNSSNYPSIYISPVERAFNRWANATQYFTFSRVSNVATADLKVSWERGDHGDDRPFTAGTTVLAHAFAPSDGRFHYNANQSWSIGARQNSYDVETVALHEIGHLLGLYHSQFQNAIMWSYLPIGAVKGLASDDIQGIKALYGYKK